MAIDPTVITTQNVGSLPTSPINLTDIIPHEVGGNLKQSTVNDLAVFIASYIGAAESLAFNTTKVTTGQTLPATTKKEFLFIGAGTFTNVAGGAAITTTQGLNVLTSNGSIWNLAVEVPVTVTFNGLVQTIRQGFTDTVTSEGAIFTALELIKADVIKSAPFLGAVIPTTPNTVTDNGYWIATQNGTYSNHGGFVLPVNTFAVIAVKNGVFSISQTALSLVDYAKKGGLIQRGNLDSTSGDTVHKQTALNSTSIPFNIKGYYSTSGSLIVSNGWSNTGLLPIKSVIILKSKSMPSSTVANICFFNSGNSFLGFQKFESSKTEVITGIPDGTTFFAVTKTIADTNTKLFSSDINDNVAEKTISLTNDLEELKRNNTVLIDGDIAFTIPNTYWNTSGTLSTSSAFHTTPKTLISDVILVKGSPYGASNVANISFFDDFENHIYSERFDSDSFRYFSDLSPLVAYFSVTKTTADTSGFVRMGTPKNMLSSFLDSLKKVDSGYIKKSLNNYFPNYSLLNLVKSSGTASDVIGTGGDFTLVNDGTFESVSIQGKIEATKLAAGNIALFNLGKDHYKPSFLINKIINIKFYLKVNYTGTLRLDLYRQNSSLFGAVGTKNISVVSGEIKEHTIKYDLSSQDMSDFVYLSFFFITAPAAKYEISGIHIWDGNAKGESIQNLLSKNDIEQISASTNVYYKKNCLYIGDSISNNDDKYWKGYIQSKFNLNYLSDFFGAYDPAIGGKKLYPPAIEDTSNYSMWYLCGAQRLVGFNPDFINLFGGTNDSSVTDLGLSTDVAYLDTIPTRPTNLTWASAFKGCIEMLMRDFPTKEIIINTVLDTEVATSIYAGGLKKSEFMAKLQMDISALYGLKCVPFYWCTGITLANNRVFTSDGVHPNKAGAIRMANCFAETLFLK